MITIREVIVIIIILNPDVMNIQNVKENIRESMLIINLDDKKDKPEEL